MAFAGVCEEMRSLHRYDEASGSRLAERNDLVDGDSVGEFPTRGLDGACDRVIWSKPESDVHGANRAHLSEIDGSR